MSKIGSWVVDLQERKAQVKYTNPYNRHYIKETTTGEDYENFKKYLSRKKSNILV